MRPTADAELRYRQLFDRYHREVYGYCRRRTDPDTAADCVAETFLVAWRRLDDVPEGDAGLGWLYGVARRTLANEYRRTRRWRRLLSRLRRVDDRVREATPEAIVVQRERDRTVLAALEQLRPEDRELLRLALREELPHAEIGVLLGCSTDAATHRIHRATRRATKKYRRLDHSHLTDETPRQMRGGETT